MQIIAGLSLGGGAQESLYLHAKNIDQKRFKLIICCLEEEGAIAERIRAAGFKVICLKGDRYRVSWSQLTYNLYKLMKYYKIDIVETHLYKADFWGRLVAFIAGIHVICRNEHTVQHPMIFGVWSEISSPFYNVMRLIGIKWLLDKITDVIIYDTKYARESFVGKRFNTKKHQIVHAAISKSRLFVSKNKESLRESFGLLNSDFIIIIVARLIERKAHKYLFEAVAKISIYYPKIKLLVVGDGPLMDGLKRLAVDFNISNITFFMGNVENVQDYVKMSDVFVMPAWREAFGVVFLESMYLGVPVIGADEGGVPEIIEDNVSGYLVKVKSSESIEKAILKVIHEPEKTKKMIEHAKIKLERKFSEKVITRKYADIYLSFIQRYIY